jgi:transaldolase
VPPDLAYDTEATVKTAQNLWNEIKRPNLMIKVPATEAGLPAIERLIAGGINVNVTLLFSLSRYEQVVETFLRGLKANPEPTSVVSVASFFVSRIDSKVDQALTQAGTPEAMDLRGKIAIANAKLAYRHYQEVLQSEAFKTQRARGARSQRLLWASTGTKNPDYSDVLYIDKLIGANTVNTVPPSTLDAFLHHGEVRATLEEDIDIAERDIHALETLGINLDEITQQLEKEGVASFLDSYQQLLSAINQKRYAVAEDFTGIVS